METLHLKSTTDPQGKVHLGDVDVGIPNAEVEVIVSFHARQTSDAIWENDMRSLDDHGQEADDRHEQRGENSPRTSRADERP